MSHLNRFNLFFVLILSQIQLYAQSENLLSSEKINKTATYQELISFLNDTVYKHKNFEVSEVGSTDIGLPLHLIKLIPSGEAKVNILINNNIHPGESDGIEATIKLIKGFMNGTIELPQNTQVFIIACYNVGGMLNRNSNTRVNQNGPKSYGFRGNARNFDLNRDFIKADTKNSFSFYELFHQINPAIFIDNHVSNGADYQYTLTYLFSQHNKLGGPLAQFQEQTFIPDITNELILKKIPSTPYVNVFNQPPNTGFSQFLDSPRYSSGFTSLWNNISFMIETHMLKDYKKRVEVTYETLLTSINYLDQNHELIKKVRNAQNEYWLNKKEYPIQWKLDSNQIASINFEGYHHSYEKSSVTGLKRLKYHTHEPKDFQVAYYNNYKPSKSVKIPTFYIIPKQWNKIIKRLKANNIKINEIREDTLINVVRVKIKDYETVKNPYEGHYLHYNTTTEEEEVKLKFTKGDYIVPTNQLGIRYLIEVLEPEAVDSFFNWNFFDSILQRKEGFSPYVFEDKALEILNNNQKLKQKFEELKSTDEKFAKDSYLQLNWIYEASGIQEKEYMSYPILKIY